VNSKRKWSIVLICVLVLTFFQSVSAQPVRPLIVNEEKSKIWNKTTQQTWIYNEFVQKSRIERTFNAGDEIYFEFILKNIRDSSSIPRNYRIDLATNLQNPTWTFLDQKREDTTWSIWNIPSEHDMKEIKITLEGKIPEPVSEVTECHFDYVEELLGILEREIFVTINVTDGTQVIQELTTSELQLYATSEDLKNYVEETKRVTVNKSSSLFNKHFENGEETCAALSDLRGKIIALAEQGHPGWAYDISQSLKSFDESTETLVPTLPPIDCERCKEEECCPPCPTILYIIIGLVIGAVVGVFIGKVMGKTQGPYINLDDQIKKIDTIRKRIQEIREDESKRKIELIGPETELRDLGRRLESINADLNQNKSE
jgi:hypothetical protein